MDGITIPNKRVGDKLRASEVNEMTEALRAALTRREMTTEEYFKLDRYDPNCFYVLTDANGFVDYLYLGPLLIARRDKGNGSVGYPYSFPIVF